MHQPSTDKPTQAELIFPMLETLHQMGGSASAGEVAEALADRFDLPSSVRTATKVMRDGQRVDLWRRHVRFARQKAKELGYLTSDRRGGEWKLTETGKRGLQFAQPAVVVEIITGEDGLPVGARIEMCVGLPTSHVLTTGDARNLDFIDSDVLPLIVSSVPYFDLKRYDGGGTAQLGDFNSYRDFMEQMEAVLRECQRVLMPGGRLAINVGDVLRSRAQHGEHMVLPLHAHLLTRGMKIGLRPLNGILWHKPTNCNYEQKGAGAVLGTPGMPNGIIKSEVEHILLFRKAGPYRSVSPACQRDSKLSKDEYARFFRPIWNDISGASTQGGHPAPFPVELAYRIIKMFSFAGDTVLDPFSGSGTTSVAAAKAGRHSIGVDVAARYVRQSIDRMKRADLELIAA